MFLNYFPVVLGSNRLACSPFENGCPSPQAEQSWYQGPWWGAKLLQRYLWILSAEETAGPCFSLPVIKRNVWWWISVCYFDGAWSIFWTWKRRGKRERWSFLWKILFYCLIILPLCSQISLFMSFPLLYLLVYFICKLLPCPCELVIQVLQST